MNGGTLMALRENSHRFWTTIAAMAGACLVTHVGIVRADAGSGLGISIHRYAQFDARAVLENKSIAAATSGGTARPQVVIDGKQLSLQLQDHAALLGPAVAASTVTLQRGSVVGIEHSWVRLTRVKSGTHGLIWDGAELYAIEPAADIRHLLDAAAPTPQNDTVIFKLSDTTIDMAGNYCGASQHDDAATGLAMYRALATDPQPTNDSGTTPTLRLEMQALADAAFRAQFSTDQDARDAVIVRLNNVDGIYRAQLGLAIEATDIELLNDSAINLTASTDPGTLLSAAAQLRSITPAWRTYAATHLFTGRDLDGDTLGISYIGNLCNPRYASSLSESRNRGAWLDSLVAAHELGHQLGAVHDGTGACSDTPPDLYLMSATINGTDQFSSCSLNAITNTMKYAACLVPFDSPVSSGATSGGASDNASTGSDHGGGSLTMNWLLALSLLCGGRQLHRGIARHTA